MLPWLPVICAALLFACSRTLWAYATIAEVYTLNALMILTVLFLMARWRRLSVRHGADKAAHDRWLYASAVVFGLALGVHHVTVAAILPAIAVLVYRTAGAKFFLSRRLVIAAALSFGALVLVYLYLPIAAARDPVLNWGNPRTLAGVWRHISGWQYQSYLSFEPRLLGAELASFGRLLGREFGPRWFPLVLIAAAGGAATTFRRDRTTFWLLALIVVVNAGYNLSYSIAEDKDAYYLPTFMAVVCFAAFGVHSLAEVIFQWQSRAVFRWAGAVLLVAALPAIALASNWRFNNRSQYFVARDYVENIQGTIAPHGLLLTLDWQVQSPMLYTREVERKRTDIKVIDINLLRRSWYFDYLGRAYPEMMMRSQLAVQAFLTDLRAWESEPAAYARDPGLTQRISARFTELCASFVRQEGSVAPVYLTSDVLLAPGSESQTFSRWLASTYNAVPKGLVFELFSDRSFHDPGEWILQTRGLADGTLHFEPDDVVMQKVLPAYAIMSVNRGRYLAHNGDHRRAVEAFRRALALSPQLPLARDGLEMSLAQLPKE